MTAPFIVHSRAGQPNVEASTIGDALRWQETLLGEVIQDGVVVAEALS